MRDGGLPGLRHRHPRPQVTLREAIRRWKFLRNQGVPENSHTREMVALRKRLLRTKYWHIVYQ